jgi:hypothetical protein
MNRLSLALLLLLQTAASQAQDLRLFEEIEGLPVANQQAPQPVMAAPGNTQPAFTLRSLSRFGERYEAVLLDRTYRPVRVSWAAGESAGVPGFGGFMVQSAGSGALTLIHPPTDPCISVQTSGVSCTAGNSATLALVPAKPLAMNGSVPQPQFGNGQGQQGPQRVVQEVSLGIQGAPPQSGFNQAGAGVDASGPGVFLNPFSGQVEQVQQMSDEERAARGERQAQRAMRLRQMEPTRIDPASLPPGTRIESTPFGDRIVRD